jgi:hydrogenase maturation protease
MKRGIVDRLAQAVLYEGYILYPYRPSVKNRQRWTFGGLYPEAWCQTQAGDAASNQTECLIRGSATTTFEAITRFLHLTARVVGEISLPLGAWPELEPPFHPVDALQVGDRLYQTWQEAEEREVVLDPVRLGELVARPQRRRFTFPGSRRIEQLRGPADELCGVLVREQRTIEGVIEFVAVALEEGLFRLTFRILNQTPLAIENTGREEALLHSLVSAHTILGVGQGEFISLLDPGEYLLSAASCRNVGTWPVLVGEEGERDTMLSSPITLYDYPQVAPESPGDFFDCTEIDEILTLRILTLTDEEKRTMAAVDERAAALLARAEAFPQEHLQALHGTFRKQP